MNDSIYGQRRQGKSTLGLGLAVTRHRRVAIFDPSNQYPLVRSVDFEGLQEWVIASRETKGFSIVRVGPFSAEEIPEAFTMFADILVGEHDISVIVDEAHQLQGGNWIHPGLDRFNRNSPGDVAFIKTTHRLVNNNLNSRYFDDNVFFFYTDNAKELKTIAEQYGERTALALPVLEPYQVVRYYRLPGGKPRVELWPDGREWYIDLENGNHA